MLQRRKRKCMMFLKKTCFKHNYYTRYISANMYFRKHHTCAIGGLQFKIDQTIPQLLSETATA